MKKYAEQFYKSRAWKTCRESYIKTVGGVCEECAKYGIIAPAEEVHHKVHLNERNINDPHITLDYSNLIALCRECHRRKHSKRNANRRYTVDEYGRVTPIQDSPGKL